MKVKIKRSPVFGWDSYVWDESRGRYVFVTFSFTKIGAKYSLNRYKKIMEADEEYEIYYI